MQVCNLYICSADEGVINVRVCQQQTNTVDCSVYAVAKVFFTLSNGDISPRQLKGSAMCEYFVQCMKRGKFVEFSESEPTEIVL